ncbi:MAG: hypothetical protein ACREAC_17325 [Blastocatellia bacterium]
MKVWLAGSGFVGATEATLLVMQGIGWGVVFVDKIVQPEKSHTPAATTLLRERLTFLHLSGNRGKSLGIRVDLPLSRKSIHSSSWLSIVHSSPDSIISCSPPTRS